MHNGSDYSHLPGMTQRRNSDAVSLSEIGDDVTEFTTPTTADDITPLPEDDAVRLDDERSSTGSVEAPDMGDLAAMLDSISSVLSFGAENIQRTAEQHASFRASQANKNPLNKIFKMLKTEGVKKENKSVHRIKSNASNIKVRSLREMERKNIFMHFKDAELERRYVKFHYSIQDDVPVWRHFQRVKIVMAMGLIFWGLFLIVDCFASTAKLDRYIIGIVLRVLVFLVMFLFFMLMFVPRMSRHYILVELFGSFVLTCLVVATCIKAASYTFDSSSFPIGTMLTCLSCYLLPRPRFHLSFIIALSGIFAYTISHLAYNFDDLQNSTVVESKRIIVYIIAVACTQLLGMLQVAIVELYFRKLFLYDEQLKDRQQQMLIESNRQENLLLNILPKEYVSHVRDLRMRFVRQYENVVVIQSDICQFTEWCTMTPAMVVVDVLNAHFSYFDQLAVKYRLEKTKTCGDAWSAFCNHRKGENNDSFNNSFSRAVAQGIAMISAVMQVNEEKNIDLHIRVGIGMGMCFLGVVGHKLITFDGFGPAFDLAEEMESNGLPDRVHVCSGVFEKTKHLYDYSEHLMYRRDQEESYILETFIPITSQEEKNLADRITRGETLTSSRESHADLASYVDSKRDMAALADSESETEDDRDVEDLGAFVFVEKLPLDDLDHLTKSAKRSNPFLFTSFGTNPDGSMLMEDYQQLRLSRSRIFLFFLSFITQLNFELQSFRDVTANFRIMLLSQILMFSVVTGCIIVLHPTLASSAALILQYVALGIQIILALSFFLASCVLPCIQRRVKATWPTLIMFIIGNLTLSLCFLATILFCGFVLLEKTLLEFVGLMALLAFVVFNMFPTTPFLLRAMLSILLHILMFTIGFAVHKPTATWDETQAFLMQLFLGTAMLFFQLIMAYIMENSLMRAYMTRKRFERQMYSLMIEQRSNKNLLLSVMPEKVLTRIVRGGEDVGMIADRIINGSVLFIGVEGFKEECTVHNNPEIALKVLNDLFNAFDSLIEEFPGCHKIKSIRSSYLAISGLDEGQEKSEEEIAFYCEQLIQFSLRARDFALQYFASEAGSELKAKWTVRMGLQTGDYVACLLGYSKYLFDVFFSTVNHAARLMQGGAKGVGEDGALLISEGTAYDCLANSCTIKFRLEPRGRHSLKGKGNLMIYKVDLLNTATPSSTMEPGVFTPVSPFEKHSAIASSGPRQMVYVQDIIKKQ